MRAVRPPKPLAHGRTGVLLRVSRGSLRTARTQTVAWSLIDWQRWSWLAVRSWLQRNAIGVCRSGRSNRVPAVPGGTDRDDWLLSTIATAATYAARRNL